MPLPHIHNGRICTYDALGRPVSRNADTFGYNSRNEVVSAAIAGGSPSPATATYAYDSIGNLLSHSSNAATNTYTANNLNQYTLCASAALREMSYDLDGNMTQCGDWTYTYDADNRLASVASNSAVVATFAYDAQGRRVRKVTPSAAHHYFYGGWLLVRETATDLSTFQPFNLSTDYVWGKDLSGSIGGAGGVGGLLAVSITDFSNSNSNSQLYIPFYDANGNITHYCDESGDVVASYTYDAFGNTIAQSGAMADIFCHRFSTKYFDAEIGLYYYGYRFYSPPLMRWLNRDPIEEQGGVNLYVFCGNRPIDKYDPTGLADCCIDGNRIRDKAIYSGVSIWRQYDRSVFGKNGLLSHAWIETDDGNSFGFYPHGRFETSSGSPKPFDEIPSSVVSPDPYAGKSKDSTFREERINLSPCRYDFGKIKRCIRAHSQMTPEPYVLFSHNCADWAKETVSFCIKYGERK